MFLDLRVIGTLLVGALGAVLFIASCQAQPERIDAVSADGRVGVVVPGELIRNAYRQMCSHVTNKPCDSMELYRVQINLNASNSSVGVEFSHLEIGQRPLEDFSVAPSFGCNFVDDVMNCSDGGEDGLVRVVTP